MKRHVLPPFLTSITLATGQLVHWPPAPDELAQVVELRRSTVRLFYRTRRRGGRERCPVVAVAKLIEVQDPARPLLPIVNPFGRAMIRRAEKTYEVRDE